MGDSIEFLHGIDDFMVLEGHTYMIEVLVPGHEAVIYSEFIYNGTNTIQRELGDELGIEVYSYSLSAYIVAVIYLLVLSAVIAYGIPFAFRGKSFGRCLVSILAVFFSSASIPLEAVQNNIAHNWILGIAAFFLLLAYRKEFK